MANIDPSVFRAYDIRGVVDRDFDPDWVEKLGRALGSFFRERGRDRVVVGYDCRHSSPLYAERLCQGLNALGRDVILIGQVPTPVFYYAVTRLSTSAGVIITASHNPPEYNGFKIWEGHTTIHTDDIQEVLRHMRSDPRPVDRPGVLGHHDMVPGYIAELAAGSRIARPVKVVVDGGNGAGGQICADLLTASGAEVIPLFCDPDGDFPNHHPDPTIAGNLVRLSETVREHGADFGFGLDGDADRIGAVDAQGNMIYGDRLLALYARDMLEDFPGARVVGEVKCSHLLYRDIEEHGGVPDMWMAGHSMIKARMKETGALLAGEMSGHMFFADRFYGFDDAIYSGLRLAEIVSRSASPLAEMVDTWPETFNTPEIRMDCPEEIKFPVIEKAREFFPQRYDCVTVDGVRLILPDGWALLRASNTQPALVMRFEAETESRLAEIRKIVEDPLAQWIAAMSEQA